MHRAKLDTPYEEIPHLLSAEIRKMLDYDKRFEEIWNAINSWEEDFGGDYPKTLCRQFFLEGIVSAIELSRGE